VKTRQHFHWNVPVELRFMARPLLSQSSAVLHLQFYASQLGGTELDWVFIGLRQKKLFAHGRANS